MINLVKKIFYPLIWLFSRLVSFIKWVFRTLCHHETPLWVTLALFGATAWLTYTFSPALNAKFEQQRIISGYVTENLEKFNVISRELVSEISSYTHNLQSGTEANESSKNKIFSKITELQWRAIELDMIFDDAQSLEKIQLYKKSLNDLRRAVQSSKTKSDMKDIVIKIGVFTESSMKVFEALALKAGLKVKKSEVHETPKE